VGALEAKKSPLFSGWPLERCGWSTQEDSKLDSQLETVVPGAKTSRTGSKASQFELFSKSTGEIGKLDDNVKGELFSFLAKHGGDWKDSQVPRSLVPLLAEGRIV
jgi:hypothetical protein